MLAAAAMCLANYAFTCTHTLEHFGTDDAMYGKAWNGNKPDTVFYLKQMTLESLVVVKSA